MPNTSNVTKSKVAASNSNKQKPKRGRCRFGGMEEERFFFVEMGVFCVGFLVTGIFIRSRISRKPWLAELTFLARFLPVPLELLPVA